MREIITSAANKKIKLYSKLLKKKGRREFSMFIVEGYHMVNEAKEKAEVVEVITSSPDEEGTLVAPYILEKLSSNKTPQPIIAIVKYPKAKPTSNRILALNNVQDPGNVGTLIRTARAFGFSDVIVQGADIYSPKTLSSTQGSIFGINVIQTKDITKFFEDKQVIGAMLDKKSTSYNELKLSQDFVLVLGNEGQGIEERVQSKLTDKVYIPIEFESLNVASAGAILLNEYKKSA